MIRAENLSTFEAFKHLKNDRFVPVDDEALAKIQAVLLETLHDVDAFCAAQGLHYALCGGSALGAVRHQGFIPWDDDLDMVMSRADFDAFANAFAVAFRGKYCLQTPAGTPERGIMLATIRRCGTTYRGKDDSQPGCHGVAADIFIVENVPDNVVVRQLHGFACMAMGFGLSCRRFARDARWYVQMAEGSAALARTVRLKAAIGRVLSFASVEAWARATDRAYRRCRNGASRLVTIPGGRNHYFGEMMERRALLDTVPMRFVDGDYPVIAGYDEYLTQLYGGDYRQMPPPDQREHHLALELDLSAVDAPPARRSA